VYGYRSANVLRNEEEKAEIVEGFRSWLIDVRKEYEGPISIVAHSFGSYIVGRYLSNAGDISEKFECVILCGSILTTNFDWGDFIDRGIVGRVLNTISEEDEWVRYIPDGGIRFLAKDDLFGAAGKSGFVKEHPQLCQIRSALLTHNNVFREDVVTAQWLPYLEASKGALEQKAFQLLLERLKSETM